MRVSWHCSSSPAADQAGQCLPSVAVHLVAITQGLVLLLGPVTCSNSHACGYCDAAASASWGDLSTAIEAFEADSTSLRTCLPNGVQHILPAPPALLAAFDFQLLRDDRPALGAVLVHQLPQLRIRLRSGPIRYQSWAAPVASMPRRRVLDCLALRHDCSPLLSTGSSSPTAPPLVLSSLRCRKEPWL